MVAALGCSNAPSTPATDAGEDVEKRDVPVFVGPGSLTVTWTINGMPPTAERCAEVMATTVEMSSPDFSAQRSDYPCTQGMVNFPMANSGQYGLTTILKGAAGSVYAYELPVTVESGGTATANIDFSPPGRARIRWTINGERPSAELCTSVSGTVVGISIGSRLMNLGANCQAGTFLSNTLQPGEYNVRAQLINQPARMLLNEQTARVTVPAATTGEVTVDFTARVTMMP